MHMPQAIEMTCDQMEELNPIGYEFMTKLALEWAKDVYKYNPNEGLEKWMESILKLMEKGWLKVLYNESEGCVYLGKWNIRTGDYDRI